MIFCPKCKSVRVNTSNMNSGNEKNKLVDQEGRNKKEFICNVCSHLWFPDPKAKEKYLEYKKLKDETTLVAQIVTRGKPYNPQHLDIDKLMKRNELAKLLVTEYMYSLDIDPSEWHELQSDAL